MNVNYLLVTVLLSLSIVLFGYGQGGVRSYYFPVAELTEGKVYVYKELQKNNFEYWLLSTEIVDGDTLFTTTFFNSDLEVKESTTELIETEGATVVRVILFTNSEDNELLPTNCFVFKDEVFRFKKSGKKYRYKFMTDGPYDLDLLVQKERKNTFEEPQKVTFDDVEYECLVVRDQVTNKYMDQDKELVGSKSWQETHLYGKGIGKLKTIKDEEGTITTKQLEMIMDVEDFVKLLQEDKE